VPLALAIEAEAVARLLVAGGTPPQWSETYDFHDPSAGITSVVSEDFVYVCTAKRMSLKSAGFFS
jgi:hypothetical protein